MPKYPPSVKDELLHRAKKEQSLRQLWEKDLESQKIIDKIRKVDINNTAFLKKVVKRYGWPKISEVGKKVAMAAWLILQHSPDKKFMEECLSLMEVMPDEVEPTNLARTIDRVRILNGKLQYYGTHFRQKSDGKYEIMPTEDKKHLEKRRKAMGLPTVEEMLKRI